MDGRCGLIPPHRICVAVVIEFGPDPEECGASATICLNQIAVVFHPTLAPTDQTAVNQMTSGRSTRTSIRCRDLGGAAKPTN
jgi:hypothetical protein